MAGDRPRRQRSTPSQGTRRIGSPLDVRSSLMVCLGGAVGAVARLRLNEWMPFSGHGWPWATFVANTLGTVLLAYFFTRLQERLPPTTYRRPLLGTGFCGALTTFSTFQVEILELGRHDHVGVAVAYAGVSLAVGFACALVVTKATRRTGMLR